jgi:hypothetical protein
MLRLFLILGGGHNKMGRQIRFFMYGDDESMFFDYIIGSGDSIVDKKGNILDKGFLSDMNLDQVYIKSSRAILMKRESGYLDEFESNIIEWSRSCVEEDNKKNIQDGRLWIELIGYNQEGTTYRKEKWVEDKYNYYKKWIVKNSMISKDKMYYIGQAAYKIHREQGYRLFNLNTEIEFE